MAKVYGSVFQALLGRSIIDSHIRSSAADLITTFFNERLSKFGISGISRDEIEELAHDLIDELCIEEYTYVKK